MDEKKLLEDNNQYYEELEIEKEKLQKANKKIVSLQKKVKILENAVDSHTELFNMIFIDSNFEIGGPLRKLQLQTFELLRFVVNVCEKYGYTYWLDYGTLVGAIRHNGFIPWDDEADISMLRDDYEEFIKVIEIEIDNYPQLKNVELRKGVGPLRNVTFKGKPAPCSQFVQVSPLANVDIHPIDYYETSPDDDNKLLKEYDSKEFIEYRQNLRDKIIEGNYSDFSQLAIEYGEKINITFDRTNFMGSPMDGTIRVPLHTSDIFPLKKCEFEGEQFNIPNNTIKYLNAHYKSNLMKIPKVIRNHSRVDLIKERIPEDELDDEFDKVIHDWKAVNLKI
ncbi:MAG: hypothetical protein BZ137_09270 [Methanosphaera sp. rholeuAM130]|nr:MAG: hypothetical protein BZ137_09270 [Methanosphaera sp. rholeuAM130]